MDTNSITIMEEDAKRLQSMRFKVTIFHVGDLDEATQLMEMHFRVTYNWKDLDNTVERNKLELKTRNRRTAEIDENTFLDVPKVILINFVECNQLG